MRKIILMTLLAIMSGSARAESAKEFLFAKVVAGADCKQTVNNGLICEYKIGQKLRFSIKDAGGSDRKRPGIPY